MKKRIGMVLALVGIVPTLLVWLLSLILNLCKAFLEQDYLLTGMLVCVLVGSIGAGLLIWDRLE